MADHDPGAYGEILAGDYDDLYEDIPDTGEAVACLAALAGDGGLLEFGIGTGRLALPLVRRGVRVTGIEGSAPMAERLASKAEGAEIPVAVGDFTSTRVAGEFAVVVLAFNTIFALGSQTEQVACFENAARHLAPGGVFVVEAFVADAHMDERSGSLRPRHVGEGWVELQIARWTDVVDQRIARTLVHLRDAGVRVVRVNDRYASPAELDLMARIAGLVPRDRWSGWSHEPFTAASDRHISVYERPA